MTLSLFRSPLRHTLGRDKLRAPALGLALALSALPGAAQDDDADDAPAETQRWQVALFDLQRELKAELDTRISVVHSLMRQLDDRIERLSVLENRVANPSSRPGLPTSPNQSVAELARQGHTSSEIAEQTGLAVGDVELILGTIHLK